MVFLNNKDLILIRDIHVLKRVVRLGGSIVSVEMDDVDYFYDLMNVECPDIADKLPAEVVVSSSRLASHYKYELRMHFVAFAKPPSIEFQYGNANVYLDQITNMSNLALTIRTCAARGVSSLIYSSPNGIHHLHPLCIHGARGLQYKLPIRMVGQDEVKRLQKDMNSIVFDERGGESLSPYHCTDRTLIIFGSESRGVDPEIRSNATQVRRIPMEDDVISLNVAVSVGVGLYSGIQL